VKAAHGLEKSGAGRHSRMAFYPDRLTAITVNKGGAKYSDGEERDGRA